MKIVFHKTCLINDPLGQIHIHTSSKHWFHMDFVSFWYIFFLKVLTNRQTTCAKQLSLPAVTVGWSSGSITSCKLIMTSLTDQHSHYELWNSVYSMTKTTKLPRNTRNNHKLIHGHRGVKPSNLRKLDISLNNSRKAAGFYLKLFTPPPQWSDRVHVCTNL